ncbi:MAG: 50S ribosomal protein L29 [Patescibacteria group bacterium]
MKSLKMKDINMKSVEDLNKMIVEKREALRVFRFGGAGAKTKDVKQGRTIRKDIARMMTSITAQSKVTAKK